MVDTNASFIPKNSNRVQKRVRTTRRVYLFSYLSYVIFFGTLLTVLGTYFYAIQVNAQLENIKSELQVKSEQFATGDLNNVLTVEKKLIVANQSLNDSLAPSRIFSDIESVVSQNVQFTSLKYEYLPNKQFKLTLSGLASEFNQILYQRDLMNSSPLLKNAVVVKYDYSAEGEGSDSSGASSASASSKAGPTITFVFEDTLDGQAIAYQPVLSEEQLNQNFATEVRGNNDENLASSTVPATDVTNSTN